MKLNLVVDEATKRLGPERGSLLQRLARCEATNLRWYLDEKIVRADDESFRDHERALKYAYVFCHGNGQVKFLKESGATGQRMPDLEIQVDGFEFFVEVKKFRTGSSGDPVSKIVDAVGKKRNQLPDSKLGFVAIDNFDLGLESTVDGLSHHHLVSALIEVERLAAENPEGWGKPSGVIVSAMSTGGVVNVVDGGERGIGIPHFVWINSHGRPSVPADLVQWLTSALPAGEIFNPHQYTEGSR